MDLLDRVKLLCNENHLSQRKLEQELGFGNGAITKWKKSTPSTDALKKVAEFFDVQLDWLTGTSEFRTRQEAWAEFDTPENLERIHRELDEINRRDERDIAKRLESALNDLDNSQDALMFSGEPLDDETRELLKASLENSIRIAKINAKQKFTPKKYRKDNE